MLITDIVNINHNTPFARTNEVHKKEISTNTHYLRIFKKLRERRLYPKLPMLVSEKKENKEQERLAQAKAKKIDKKEIIAGGPKGI